MKITLEVNSIDDLMPNCVYLDTTDGEEVVFSRIGGTGMAIFHPPGEPDMQSSFAMSEENVKKHIRLIAKSDDHQ